MWYSNDAVSHNQLATMHEIEYCFGATDILDFING